MMLQMQDVEDLLERIRYLEELLALYPRAEQIAKLGSLGLQPSCACLALGLYAAKRSGRNAWVEILSTDRLSLDEVASPLDTHLPQLVRDRAYASHLAGYLRTGQL